MSLLSFGFKKGKCGGNCTATRTVKSVVSTAVNTVYCIWRHINDTYEKDAVVLCGSCDMHNWGILPELAYDLNTGEVFHFDYGGIRDNDYEVKNTTVIYSAYINDKKAFAPAVDKVKVGLYQGNSFVVPCEY